ncbi:ATP-binding protein [Solirhodobacter olei]|uniref:ATP-binding protein n=1 Tax=Solirhodobacter olei TaxID=2493082 RepID=UPI000FDAB867|nr:ATP-binding protein [Solirhodobacter olei]
MFDVSFSGSSFLTLLALFLAAMAAASALSVLATLQLSARKRRRAQARTAAEDHAPRDHELLWKALDAHVMVNVADAAGQTVSVNDSFVTQTGYPREEVLGRELRTFLFAPGTTARPDVVEGIRREGKWTGETHIVRRDGSRFWTRTTIVGDCDASGALRRTVSVRTDITQAKVLQEAAQKKRLLERLCEEVYVVDAETFEVSYLNQSALTHLGWSGKDYAGRTLTEVNPKVDEAALRTRLAGLREGTAEGLSYESIEDGRAVEVSLQLDRSFDNRESFIAVVRDITARRQAEAARAAFVSTVSHELRAPLTSVLGALKLLTAGALGEIAEKPAEVLGIAVRNVQRLVVTINDLLDLEKFEAGKMDMPLEPTDLAAVVEEAVACNASYAAELDVTLRVIGLEGRPVVPGNRDRLIQVLNNLLSNAAKFSRPGQAVEVELRSAGGAARIIVRDRGIGIPEEFQSRLFERFAQAGGGGGRPTGSGLGLSIAKVIVEGHGGRISFTSKPGEGTSFYVELPRIGELEDAA